MSRLEYLLNLKENSILVYILKIFFISFGTYMTTLKIINVNKIRDKKVFILNVIYIMMISIICGTIKKYFEFFNSIISLVALLSILNFTNIKKGIGYSIIITIISLSINYILFFLSISLGFFPNVIINVRSDFISLFSILIIYMIMIALFYKVKKFKNGILFLKKNLQNEYIDILILNISVTILFAIILLVNSNMSSSKTLIMGLIIFSIIMFITIQKSLQLYYKQKLLEQELDETKEELEKKQEEVKQLEAENLNFSKTSHSLAHKQKSLEYKLEQLKQKYEIAEEIEIEDRIKDISKELYNKTPEVELSKTGITEIDDMLKYMQSECIKNKIDFKLQIKGNIYEMINNYVSKEDLTILLADHIKNAIIAIKHSENINKTILVRLGKIDKIYSLYIYDSGIEFKKETLSNLGKKPSTTHADSGGTGMGFMNTFDTLKKYKASLIINEYNKPCKDNYTKSIMIKFDKKQEFKINSYR